MINEIDNYDRLYSTFGSSALSTQEASIITLAGKELSDKTLAIYASHKASWHKNTLKQFIKN